MTVDDQNEDLFEFTAQWSAGALVRSDLRFAIERILMDEGVHYQIAERKGWIDSDYFLKATATKSAWNNAMIRIDSMLRSAKEGGR